MAALDKILWDLKEEMRQKIVALTPSDKATHRFYSDAALNEQPLVEMTGKARLFQVQFDPSDRDRVGFGCSYRGWKMRGFIVVGYPIETKWDHTMLSDYDLIYDVFNQSNCTVTGVAYRHVPDEAQPTTEDLEGDWRWHSIPFEASVWTDA